MNITAEELLEQHRYHVLVNPNLLLYRWDSGWAIENRGQRIVQTYFPTAASALTYLATPDGELALSAVMTKEAHP